MLYPTMSLIKKMSVKIVVKSKRYLNVVNINKFIGFSQRCIVLDRKKKNVEIGVNKLALLPFYIKHLCFAVRWTILVSRIEKKNRKTV